MLLSNQTREGLKITGKHNSANLLLNLCSQVYINLFPSVNSFVEITQFLLSVPGVQYVLPEKLCQDPVEAFFLENKGQLEDGVITPQYINFV